MHDILDCMNRTKRKARAHSTIQTVQSMTANGVMIKRMEMELTLIQMEIHTQVSFFIEFHFGTNSETRWTLIEKLKVNGKMTNDMAKVNTRPGECPDLNK